jgi:ribosomal protein S18 acetylase RimI-like enzyme
MPQTVDAATHRRLLRHEAEVHAIPGRELRDLGDALLLHDADDPEPFWNRIESISWPADPVAFDRRLAETAVLFAAIGRQPHAWLSPPYDEPADLAARLVANGFEDMGHGMLMVADDDARARSVLTASPLARGTTLERFTGLTNESAAQAADAISAVLVAAFEVGESRRASLAVETETSLADPRFTHYLVRHDGQPVAVARRATFDGLSYLSSIGTLPEVRGRGYGRFVTATALVDARSAGSEWVHLGVFADNATACQLYERLGFVVSGQPGPDMMLIG